MTRDLRNYAKQTNRRLLAGGIVLFFLVGDGLIYLIYGQDAALFGALCFSAGLLPLILIWVIFFVIEWVLKRSRIDED